MKLQLLQMIQIFIECKIGSWSVVGGASVCVVFVWCVCIVCVVWYVCVCVVGEGGVCVLCCVVRVC